MKERGCETEWGPVLGPQKASHRCRVMGERARNPSGQQGGAAQGDGWHALAFQGFLRVNY